MARKKGFIARYAVIDLNDPRQRRRIGFFVIAGMAELLVLTLLGFRGVVYMDTAEFCGKFCHQVMAPQYTAYQVSPHARVSCVQCHIGPGAAWMVKSKINGIPQIYHTLAATFHRPIPTPVENLRPARDTCEVCHWPAKFTGDLARLRSRSATDDKNTETVTTTFFKVGGGDEQTARDIHWHIAAKVWYLALDKQRQDIAWVGVENKDGAYTEYVSPKETSQVSAFKIAQERRLMDCIDCHNRATHIFRSPGDLIDESLAQGKIDRGLPFIKKKALEIMDTDATPETMVEQIGQLKDFYQNSYPQLYAEKQPRIEQAVAELSRIARIVRFPDMKVDWKTHYNNVGHTSAPGCFRCHGKLVKQTDGESKGKPMEAKCNICHYSAPVPANKP